MGRKKVDSPRTEDLRIKVSREFLSRLEEAKMGSEFRNSSTPDFALMLMELGLRRRAIIEEQFPDDVSMVAERRSKYRGPHGLTEPIEPIDNSLFESDDRETRAKSS